jgi:predicted porin
MKAKYFFIFILFLLFAVPTVAQVKVNGYLSFEYLKGEKQSGFHQGSFQNARAGLITTGQIAPRFDFALEARLRGEYQVELEQAWAGFKASEAFSLKLGLFLVPFGKYNQSNRPHQTLLIRSPLNLEDTYPASWRDIGVLAEGKIGIFLYSAYLGNGLAEAENLRGGQQFNDNNSDKGKGTRIGLLLAQKFEVGVSYYRGKQDERNERNLRLLGFDLSWDIESFQVLAEYSKGEMENPSPGAKGKAEGYFVQLSFPVDRFNAVVSYQDFSYKDAFHGPGFQKPAISGQGIDEDSQRWALGLDYSFSQNLLLKLEYDFNKARDRNLKANLFLAQVALSF